LCYRVEFMNLKLLPMLVWYSSSGRGRGRKRAAATPTDSPPKLHVSARNSAVKGSPEKATPHGVHWNLHSVIVVLSWYIGLV